MNDSKLWRSFTCFDLVTRRRTYAVSLPREFEVEAFRRRVDGAGRGLKFFHTTALRAQESVRIFFPSGTEVGDSLRTIHALGSFLLICEPEPEPELLGQGVIWSTSEKCHLRTEGESNRRSSFFVLYIHT